MLKEILSRFLVLNGVQAAILIQENGEIIEIMKSGLDMNEDLRFALSELMRDSLRITIESGNPALSMVVAEFSDSFLILGPVLEEFYLIIIAGSSANIGQITYEMKKNQDAIVSLL